MLVNMIFGLPCLEFSRANELQHVELFAGECAVTRSELQDLLLVSLGSADCHSQKGFNKKKGFRESWKAHQKSPLRVR